MDREIRKIVGPIIWWTEGTKAYQKKSGNNPWVKNGGCNKYESKNHYDLFRFFKERYWVSRKKD